MNNIQYILEEKNLNLEQFLQNAEIGDILAVGLNEYGEKHIIFKKNPAHKDNISPENFSNEISLKNISTNVSEKHKCLISNGINWVPTKIDDFLLEYKNCIEISDFYKNLNHKISKINFINFNLKFLKNEVIIDLPTVPISKLYIEDYAASDGDCLVYNKITKQFQAQKIKLNSIKEGLAFVSFSFPDLNIKKSNNILNIETNCENELIYLHFKQPLPSLNAFPYLSTIGKNNNFCIEELNLKYLALNPNNCKDSILINVIIF